MSSNLQYGAIHQEICAMAYRGLVQRHCEALSDKLESIPRWRILRRFHLGRQLVLWTMAEEVYRIGLGDGIRACRHD